MYSLKTIADVDILKEEINVLLDSLYKSNFEEVLYSKVRANMPRDQESLSKLLKKLSTLRTLKLVLAVEPSQALVDSVSSWVKNNIGEDVVLDLSLDSSLIGGAQISFAGKYADYSLISAYDQFCHTT